ncbi:MAG TPA: response regulator [Thermoanaerobaculia bacterium]|nr:response regulator [Thermoanaerobaculia bacterium]
MRRKALIVEDDAATRELLRRLVESQQCDVDEAADGQSAIELLDRNDYGVVLLDLVLPKLSGAEVLDHLYRNNPSMLERIIVVTGLNIEEVRKLFPRVCNALPKPVMPQRLMASIQKCLHVTTDEFLMSN